MVKDISPSFHGDALEDSKYGEQDVVKVSDAIVWSFPRFAFLTLRAIGTQPRRRLQATWVICSQLLYRYTHTHTQNTFLGLEKLNDVHADIYAGKKI